jgi:hypothetical protein
MRKREALALKPGVYLRWGRCYLSRTVVAVLPEPTAEDYRGTFPLVKTEEEKGAVTYKRLERKLPPLR